MTDMYQYAMIGSHRNTFLQ